MQTLDNEQAIRLLSERGLLDPRGEPSFPGFVEVFHSVIPGDSGRRTTLSKEIASLFNRDDEALLWIDEYGIWPSSEDQFLFEGFRQSLGEAAPVYEKPGHIFSSGELRAVGSLVALVLYFSWGAILYSRAREFVIRISHDEIISVFVKRSDDVSDVAEALRRVL